MADLFITGASSGIGAEFARQLDCVGYTTIWMVARNREKMQQLGAQLRTPVRIEPADLSERTEVARIAQMLHHESPHIGCAVLSAGFGISGDFTSLPIERQLQMVDVNVAAVLQLSYALVSCMSRGSTLCTISSAAGFAPLGGFAVFSATKALVTSFTHALGAETARMGIHTMAVCPGRVNTGFRAATLGEGNRSKKLFTAGADVSMVVAQAIRDIRTRRTLSVYGRGTRTMLLLSKIIPQRLFARLSERFVYR
jgi:short-subunit dehydrogenase